MPSQVIHVETTFAMFSSYEREIICGQRSCIRRIQERDSSPWLPMILVVAEIIYEERELPPEQGSDEERQGIVTTEMVPVAIVLSDGWYKIRTSSLDDSLYRAICFRNIYPGLKIRLQGAKVS
jgi:breast cancer 2 susceptibility protein